MPGTGFQIGNLRYDLFYLTDIEQAGQVRYKTTISNHTHESSRVGYVCADFLINLDETLFQDLLYFIIIHCILEPVPQEDNEREAFSELVWS